MCLHHCVHLTVGECAPQINLIENVNYYFAVALLTFDRRALQKVVAHQLVDFIDPEEVLSDLLEPKAAHEAAIAEGCLRLSETINN